MPNSHQIMVIFKVIMPEYSTLLVVIKLNIVKKFFKNTDELKKFLSQIKGETCPHCSNKNYLIVHSIVYRNTKTGDRIMTGQRIYCSGRGNKLGCGKTFQLYFSMFTPAIHYSTIEFDIFLLGLINDQSIQESYHIATKTQDSRNAYRWLNRIKQKIFDLRHFINQSCTSKSHTKYRNPLIETINHLKDILRIAIANSFQLKVQKSFI